MAELAEIRGQNTAAQEGNARTRVMLKLEPAGGNVYLARKGDLNRSGGIADEYRNLGDEVTAGPKDPVTQSESIAVKPGNGAEPLRVMEKAGPAETTAGGTTATGGGCFVAGTRADGTRSTPNRAAGRRRPGAGRRPGDRRASRTAGQPDLRPPGYRGARPHHRGHGADLHARASVLGPRGRVAGGGRPPSRNRCRSRNGTGIVVTAITERRGEHTVFNLEVEGFRTFFVGSAEVLVHNKSWELLPGLRPTQTQLADVRGAIERMETHTSARRVASRQLLRDRASAVEARLADLAQRMNTARTLRDIGTMQGISAGPERSWP